MYTKKDFYESQKKFVEWRNEKYESSICLKQTFNLESGILYEKWNSICKNGEGIFYIAEIYTGGDGFNIFDWSVYIGNL